MRINVTLTNRIAFLGGMDAATRQALDDFWSFSPAGLWYMPQYRPAKLLQGQIKATEHQLERLMAARPRNESKIRVVRSVLTDLKYKLAGEWDGKIRMLHGNSVPAGLFRATWKEAEQECGVKFTAEKDRRSVDFMLGLPPAEDDYRHQNECVAEMVRNVPRGGGIVLAATGTGKTAIAARLFSKVNCDCLFVVDQLDLLYQQRAELASWLGEEVGVVGDSTLEPERVTVATIQTLHRHRQKGIFRRWYQAVEVVMVDELHEQMAKRNFDVLEIIRPIAIFGLTATLRLKKKEVRVKAYSFAGPVIYTFPIEEGVKRGVLTRGHVLQLLFPEKWMPADLPYRQELRLQVTENELKLEAARTVIRMLLLEDRHVVVLTDRVKHLKEVAGSVRDLHPRLAYGAVKIEDREQLKQDFEDELANLIITNKVFKKGVNIKRIDAMLDMAEMKSKNDAVQKFGRGLRRCSGKSVLIYVDFGTETGRFSEAAASRRNALRAAGISVAVVKNVCTTGKAKAALANFIQKVTRGHTAQPSGVADPLLFDNHSQ